MLHKRHKGDVVVLYYHPHGKGDTVAYYGTPGIATKFLGLCPGQEKMPPTGKVTFDLFEKFIYRRYNFIFFEYNPIFLQLPFFVLQRKCPSKSNCVSSYMVLHPKDNRLWPRLNLKIMGTK